MEPMSLIDCLGYSQAVRLIVAHSLVCLAFLWMAVFRFLPAASQAETIRGKVAWWSITCVFPFCALCGYGTTIIAAWRPELAYPAKEILSYLVVFCCCAFLHSTRNINLTSVGNERRTDVMTCMTPLEALKSVKESL